ncbi:hypothetical protein HMPREF3088_00660 [Corynebacterium sp. HMSC22B11]|uniref:hypothetical protein n=1 Tax=Corynebacterium sp. HMSC22B11 TaxID=1581056 RepID=UPI0008A29B9B|nr:hypothetical protein [Corynebacterium sp. HMSC22B11]OFO17005.1 hypothetical protein HMPREF3088_00660 [Corynebacterium sp. HMSC22B11]
MSNNRDNGTGRPNWNYEDDEAETSIFPRAESNDTNGATGGDSGGAEDETRIIHPGQGPAHRADDAVADQFDTQYLPDGVAGSAGYGAEQYPPHGAAGQPDYQNGQPPQYRHGQPQYQQGPPQYQQGPPPGYGAGYPGPQGPGPQQGYQQPPNGYPPRQPQQHGNPQFSGGAQGQNGQGKRRTPVGPILGILLVIALLIGGFMWWNNRSDESADDKTSSSTTTTTTVTTEPSTEAPETQEPSRGPSLDDLRNRLGGRDNQDSGTQQPGGDPNPAPEGNNPGNGTGGIQLPDTSQLEQDLRNRADELINQLG